MAHLEPTLWRDMMDYLRRRHASICRQWFDELEPTQLSGGLLKVKTSNHIQQNYLQRQCGEHFNEAAQSVTGALVAVRFVTDEEDQPQPARQISASTVAVEVGAAARLGRNFTNGRAQHTIELPHDDQEYDPEYDQIVLSPDYSFDNFITGPSNQLAYAASVAVANQPGVAYNPLFIHGGVGLGKTHLLQATCQTILHSDPTTRICYLSCDTFMNHFLDCVQRGQMNEFRHRYRHVDVLVIDDIHILANRERTQEEFFHTFNALYQQNKQIVLSSDSPPHDIPQLEERLVSRFSWGLVANITRPDYETRVAIVRAKAKIRGLQLPDDVISYIATKIDSNARELEGAITTLQGHAVLQNQPITLALAQQALGDTVTAGVNQQVTLQNIIDAVTEYYNVKLSDLQSKRRHKSITEPRQVCMWLARRRTRFSLEEVGGHFGGRDHTTVMHAIKTVGERMDMDAAFARQVEDLGERITRNMLRGA
jgi:chromosomal replication initiator protein